MILDMGDIVQVVRVLEFMGFLPPRHKDTKEERVGFLPAEALRPGGVGGIRVTRQDKRLVHHYA